MKLTLDRWIAAHGREDIRNQFELNLILSAEVDRCAAEPPAEDISELYLLVEPGSAGYAVVGSAIGLLEQVNPRLGATFFHLFTGALNRWVRVYDYRDAEDRVEMLRDWYEGDPEAENYELPDVAGSVPKSVRRRPLQERAVERLLRKIGDRQAKEILTGVLEMAAVARGAERPIMTEKVCGGLNDCNPPLPALLAVFQPHDSIEGSFDDEAQGMLEACPEPNVILPFNGRARDSVRECFRVLGVVCDTLACASRLVKVLPGNDQ